MRARRFRPEPRKGKIRPMKVRATIRFPALVAMSVPLTAGLAQSAPAQPPAEVDQQVERAIATGLDWLLKHQDEDGKWSAALFVRHDPRDALCDGVGKPEQDLQVTSLAVIAAVAEGSTLRAGPHREAVDRATRWLIAQSDRDGFLGPKEQGNAVVAHAIATLALCALCEAGRGSLDVRDAVRDAATRLGKLRLDGGGWPRAVGGTAVDSEATLWGAFASMSAKFSKLGGVDCKEVPDLLARDPALPPAARAAARLLVGAKPDDAECAAVVASLPQWPDQADATDFLGWYLGTLACYQMGGERWNTWRDALLAASLPHQRTDGSFLGSWDPVDARGKELGRIGATALQVQALLQLHPRARIVK